MSTHNPRRDPSGAAPTPKENTHDNKRRNPLGNADPYAPVPADRFAETFTPGAVRISLKKLIGHAGLGYDDLPDMVQELLKAAWVAYGNYNPEYVSPETGKKVRFRTYIGDAMANRANMILRDRSLGIRNPDKGIVSLDDPGRDKDKPRRRDEELSLQAFQALGETPEFAAMLDRVDLEFAIEALPDNLRHEARLLVIERRPVPEVATMIGLKPTTLYHKHIPAIEVGIARVLHEHG